MKRSAQFRALAILFACVGLGWSAVYLRPPDGVSFEITSAFDLVLVFFIFAPLVLGLFALVGAVLPSVTRAALWANSGAWLLLAAGELLEGPPFLPSLLPIVGVVILAVASLILLLRRDVERAV